jgi:steroid delta-isomerase-like uncharacterized protein
MGNADVDRNKKLALLANEEIWNRGNFNKIDELFSEGFVEHFLPSGTRTEGLHALKKSLVAHRTAFPDWNEVVTLIVAEGDYVVLQFTSTGTNLGSFMGHPATGKKIHIAEVTILRIVDHKIAEQWLLPDIKSLYQQLGFIQVDT